MHETTRDAEGTGHSPVDLSSSTKQYAGGLEAEASLDVPEWKLHGGNAEVETELKRSKSMRVVPHNGDRVFFWRYTKRQSASWLRKANAI